MADSIKFRTSRLSVPARCFYHGVRHEVCLRGSARRAALGSLRRHLLEHPEYSYNEIIRNLGTTAEVALEINSSIPGFVYSKSYWRFAFLPVAMIGVIWDIEYLMYYLFCKLLMLNADFFSIISPGEAASVGVIGGADGPTAVFVASSPLQNSTLALVLCGAVTAAGFAGYYLLRHRKQPAP